LATPHHRARLVYADLYIVVSPNDAFVVVALLTYPVIPAVLAGNRQTLRRLTVANGAISVYCSTFCRISEVHRLWRHSAVTWLNPARKWDALHCMHDASHRKRRSVNVC